jgi:4a-hydroxytetrahydrobiopterin dehydratase
MALLNEIEIKERLSSLKGWNYLENQIVKEFIERDFKQALLFVNKVGEAAESIDQHPDILIHSWNKVKISLSTHSEGGITRKDFQLAEMIESLH